MATLSLTQEREVVDSGYVAVDNIWLANPSTIQSAFTILRSGTIQAPYELMLRVATVQDFNILTVNPLNRLDSAAWAQLQIESQVPLSIVWNTIPDAWKTISNTTKFVDTSGRLNSWSIPTNPYPTLAITGGYGNYTTLNPYLIPFAGTITQGLSWALYLTGPGSYFGFGPSDPTVPITYEIRSYTSPSTYTLLFASSSTGQIQYNNTYNITQQYNATANIPPQFSPVFPSATYALPAPAPVANQPFTVNQPSNLSNIANPLIGVPSNALFINRTIFPTNITIWTNYDGTGSPINWFDIYGNPTSVLNDAIIVRSDNGASTMFLDSQFYSYYSTADLAVAHSISVSQYLQTLLAQESQNLSNVSQGPLLGINSSTLVPLPTTSNMSS